jgi:hypothetical protein
MGTVITFDDSFSKFFVQLQHEHQVAVITEKSVATKHSSGYERGRQGGRTIKWQGLPEIISTVNSVHIQ